MAEAEGNYIVLDNNLKPSKMSFPHTFVRGLREKKQSELIDAWIKLKEKEEKDQG